MHTGLGASPSLQVFNPPNHSLERTQPQRDFKYDVACCAAQLEAVRRPAEPIKKPW